MNKHSNFTLLLISAGLLVMTLTSVAGQTETPVPALSLAPNVPVGPQPTATVTPLQSTPVPTATVYPLPSASPAGTQPQTTNTVAPSPSASPSPSGTPAQSTNTVTPSPK